MAHSNSYQSAESAPFNIERFGNRIGRGKDNMVRALPILGKEEDYVVKINHDNKPGRSLEGAMKSIKYKKEKYEILKYFLGDFIPHTAFELGTKVDGQRPRIAEYVIQDRLPNHYLSSLTEEQQKDSRLVYNMMLLMTKLENMYGTLGNINARTNEKVANLDGKLDLGGISGYVRRHVDSQITYETALKTIQDYCDTPNILVNPQTMDIYCVDFDEGEWTDEKGVAKNMLLDLAESNVRIQRVINLQADDLITDPSLAALAVA